MARQLGVDLGTHTIKVAVMDGRGEAQDYWIRALPQSASERPALEQQLAVLGSLLAEIGTGEGNTACVGMPAQGVSVRSVKMPFVDRDRISKTLPFELEGYVPFDVDDFVLDYRVHPDEDGEGARVQCAMAPRVAVRRLLAGLSALDCDPKHLVLDGDQLASLATGEGVQAVVDLGHTRTLVTVVRGGEILSTRAVNGGGRDLTLALVRELGLEWGAAEGIKHAARVDRIHADAPALPVAAEWEEEDRTDPLAAQKQSAPNLAQGEPAAKARSVQDVLEGALSRLLAGLRITLIAIEDELGVGVDEVLVTGGTSHLVGLAELLSQELGVPVRRVLFSDAAEALGDPGRFALSHALGIHAQGLGTRDGRHFRRDEFQYKGDLAVWRQSIGYGLVALACFCVVGSALFAVRYVQFSQEIAATEAQVSHVVRDTFPGVADSAVSSPTMARATMLEKTLETSERMEALGATVGGEPPTLVALKELTEAMPEPEDVTLDVTELTINPNSGLTFKAETSGFEAAAAIEQTLQGSKRFGTAKKSDEKRRGDGLSFTMSIPLEVEGTGEEG